MFKVKTGYKLELLPKKHWNYLLESIKQVIDKDKNSESAPKLESDE